MRISADLYPFAKPSNPVRTRQNTPRAVTFQTGQKQMPNVPFKGTWTTSTEGNSYPYEGLVATLHIYHPYADETKDEIFDELYSRNSTFAEYFLGGIYHLADNVNVHYKVGDRLEINNPKPKKLPSPEEILLNAQLEQLSKEHGENSFQVTGPLREIAELCEKQGKYSHAERTYNRLKEVLIEVYGKRSPEVYECLEKIAQMCEKQGKFYDAEKCRTYIRDLASSKYI